MTKKDSMTLEQAKQVINAHRDAESRAAREVAEQYVGKFYRYRNTYGRDNKGWWLYVAVTKALDGGSVEGWSFQATTSGELQCRIETYTWVDRGGYSEITAAAFWKAWETFKAKLLATPHSSTRRPQSRRRGAKND